MSVGHQLLLSRVGSKKVLKAHHKDNSFHVYFSLWCYCRAALYFKCIQSKRENTYFHIITLLSVHLDIRSASFVFQIGARTRGLSYQVLALNLLYWRKKLEYSFVWDHLTVAKHWAPFMNIWNKFTICWKNGTDAILCKLFWMCPQRIEEKLSEKAIIIFIYCNDEFRMNWKIFFRWIRWKILNFYVFGLDDWFDGAKCAICWVVLK